MTDLHIPYSACPLCGGEYNPLIRADLQQLQPRWHEPLPKILEWVKCFSCNHVFTHYYWTDAGLAEVFSRTLSNQIASNGDPDTLRHTWTTVIDPAVRCLGGYNDLLSRENQRVWMDVGFGDGALLMLAQEAGFAAAGVDARLDTVKAFQDLGYRALAGNFIDMDIPFKVDVLSMMDVLEHFSYPGKALEKVKRILNEDGVLIVSLPNIESSSWKAADRMGGSPYWIELEHHHNFSLKRLVNYAAEFGFKVADVKFPFRYRSQIEIYFQHDT